MGKKLSLVVVGALLLTGCASSPVALVEPVDKDAQFIKSVRPVLIDSNFGSDEALINFAPEYCEQAADGISLEEMREGALDFNSPAKADELVRMGEVALDIYCPEYAA